MAVINGRHNAVTREDREKVFKIRCASKRGQYVAEEDYDFCYEMYEKFPDEYKQIGREAYEATKPFGSIGKM